MQIKNISISRTIKRLQNHPVFYAGPKIKIVNFGFFSAFNAMSIMTVMLYYLNIKGVVVTPEMLVLLPMSGIMVWIGARLMHLVSLGRKLLQNPRKYLFETGFYLQGGVLGAVAWSILFTQVTGIPLSIVWDGLALGTLLGQFFGRVGCFNYGCCFGKPTKLKIGTAYENPDSKILRLHPQLKGVPVHPAKLYKAATNLLTFLIILFLLPIGLANGALAIGFLMYHGLTRIGFEYFRFDIYFKQKRNLITLKLAISSIFFGGLVAYLGPFLDASFYQTLPLTVDYSLVAFTQWLFSQTWMFAVIFLMGTLTFIGYGVHGQHLGRFPIPERSSTTYEQANSNRHSDHRSGTVWHKSRL